MKVLVLNSGSSSIKFKLFREQDWRVLASGGIDRIGEHCAEIQLRWADADGQPRRHQTQRPIPDHHQGLDCLTSDLRTHGLLEDASELRAIGHRVVHGGEAFHAPTLVDEGVIRVIRDMIPLAPLHNPANLDGILVARTHFPNPPQVAVFDTAFHQSMPPTAFRYAIPESLYREHRVRRYGFHGSSHQYVARRAAALLGKSPEDCNLISLHLGNGASATAIRDGRSVDTSMGMTPLEGLVMGTRSGDIDPAILFYLGRELDMDLNALDALLNRQSGLLGLCGVNDMRSIHRMQSESDDNAGLALDVFCHRLRKYIGAYTAELGRVDALIFTGGIGENDAEIRARACAGLQRLGIDLNAEANARQPASGERDIATTDSDVRILIIPTDEELEIARQTLEAIQQFETSGVG